MRLSLPRAPLRAGCGGTLPLPCSMPRAFGVWGQAGHVAGVLGVWEASSSPVCCGRLLKLGPTPSWVHSCCVIRMEFQDGQEQARQGGQGRQQVTARSCCAQGAGKWGDGSRSCGLSPPSPGLEIAARKNPAWTKASGSAPEFSSSLLSAPPSSQLPPKAWLSSWSRE